MMAESLNQKIGKRLRSVRKQTGYTAVQVAQLFNCSIDHYRRIESGRHILSPDKFILLRDYMGVDPLYLLTGEVRDDNEKKDEDSDSEIPAFLPPPVEEPHDLQVMKELFNYWHALVAAG